MKRLLAVFALALAAIPAAAGAEGYYALYADEARSTCAIADVAPGQVRVYIFAEGIDGLVVVEMRFPKPDCWEGATWIYDDIQSELVIGGSQEENGIAVGIKPGVPCTERVGALDPIYVGYMLFMAAGSGGACCDYPVVKGFSGTGSQPVAAVCDGTDLPAKVKIAEVGTRSAVINPNAACPCASLQALPVEPTSWGRVKALYR